MIEKFNKTHKIVDKCNLLNYYKNVKQQVTIIYHRIAPEKGGA